MKDFAILPGKYKAKSLIVGAVRQKKWQNSAKWDTGLEIGENILSFLSLEKI